MYTLEDFQSKKTVLYTVVAFAISEAICYSLKRWDRLSRYSVIDSVKGLEEVYVKSNQISAKDR